MNKQMFLSFAIILYFLLGVYSSNLSRHPRTVRATLHTLGLGPWCMGCPDHFCDDDPNIIQGYCCGCAGIFDNLPITCLSSLRCPLNINQLCSRYEYMMYCCC